MNKQNERQRGRTHLVRLCVAVAGALCMLLLATVAIPWHFPYDRLEHLYGIEGYETIKVGHPGGEFILHCAPINGSPTIELLINGKPYCKARHVTKELCSVTLGSELFAQPGKLELTLKERFSLPIPLRSNTISLYVME